MSENQKDRTHEDPQSQEECLTMLDVLQQEQEMEEEYQAVLGGSDEKCCTYDTGYVKRQALYSCLTCCPEAKTDVTKSIGICLACSYHCHEGHDLVELYTKRNFRCDCPTNRSAGAKCSFESAMNDKKLQSNSDNKYNQNFSGVYCVCQRPYPDPEDPIEDEMIQCVVCEDWYHTRHLNVDTAIPKTSEYSEMICGQCMEKSKILRDYVGFAVKKVENEVPAAEKDQVSVEESQDENVVEAAGKTNAAEASEEKESSNSVIIGDTEAAQTTRPQVKNDAEITVVEGKTDDKLKSDLDISITKIMNMTDAAADIQNVAGNTIEKLEEGPSIKRMKFEEITCKRPNLNNYEKGAVFWPNDWRNLLCQCLNCLLLYKKENIEFLLDREDTVAFYEENGMKKSHENDYDRGIRALGNLGHTQQIDVIMGYNRMKEKLKEFLHTFAVNNKIVTETDINAFFEGMRNERNSKATAETDAQYFCR